MRRRALLTTLLLLAFTASTAAAYTVYLKDGSKIIAQEPFTIEGEKAIIVLQNGTRTSIDASEIDLERTRQANQGNLGSAMVIEGGRVTELTTSPPPQKKETLADLIAKREVGPSASTVGPRSPASDPEPVPVPPVGGSDADYRNVPRRPFQNLEVASEVQRLFRAQGVEQILIYQGTRADYLLLDILTNSEASVFRSLEVAASALQHIREQNPSLVAAFELSLSTSEREAAGQFLITPQAAARLASREVEVSTFFVEQVRF